MKAKSLVVISLLIVGLFLGSTISWAGGDTLIVGVHQDATTLDPGNHRDRITETIIRNMYDGLITRTTDMELAAELATSWEQTSTTEWVFYLQEGVKWHDGEPFTAEDVKFTIDRLVKEGMINGETSPRKSLLGSVVDAEVIDTYTVKLILDAPMPHLLAFLPFQEMVAKHYVEEVGDDYLAENPMGTGPFKFVRWDKGTQVVMERFDDYYGGSPDIPPVGPAQVDTVIFTVIPETSSRIAALQAGEVDIITKVPTDLMSQIEGDPNSEIAMCNGTRSYFVGMNVNKAPFDDVRVRQAMNHAINMNQIVDIMYSGLGTRIPTILSPNAIGFADLDPYSYDPEKAKKLLAEAGYPNGFAVVIDTEDFIKDVAEAYAQMLREIGLDASVQVWEWGVLKPELFAGKRQMWLQDWGNGSMDPMGIFIPKLGTDARGNYTGYSNKVLDLLFSLSTITLDAKERVDCFVEGQKIVYEECPMVWGYVTKELYGKSKRVQNWSPSPDSRINLHDVSALD
jgi:peptide/nickel transport system substrate-binding protein